MSGPLNGALAAAILVLQFGAVTHARAQTVGAPTVGPPNNASLEFGPVTLSPSIRLNNFGFDDNVFGKTDAQNPEGDVTATLSPALVAWLRLPRARVSGRTRVDFVYYNELSQLSSIDTDNLVRIDLFAKFVRPYGVAAFANTRHSRTVEVDAPVTRRDYVAVVGSELRLTGKSSVDITARRARAEYEDTVFDNDPADSNNRRMAGEGVTFRYAATPLTTVGLDVQRQRDRFEFSPERDANRFRVSSLVEFRPDAVINGSAEVGVHTHAPLGLDVPEFRGLFVAIDLQYTLMGRTRFAVQADRDVEYSYNRDEEYEVAGVDVSVSQKVGDSWDVGTRVGRDHLTYLRRGAAGERPLGPVSPPETVMDYDVQAGYRLSRTRLGLQLTFRHRESDIRGGREVDQVRLFSSLTFAFN